MTREELDAELQRMVMQAMDDALQAEIRGQLYRPVTPKVVKDLYLAYLAPLAPERRVEDHLSISITLKDDGAAASADLSALTPFGEQMMRQLCGIAEFSASAPS